MTDELHGSISEAGQELAGTPAPELRPQAGGRLGVYLAVAFGGAWVFMVAASIFAIRGNRTLFTLISAIGMFMPLLGTLAACRGLHAEKAGIQGWKPRFRGLWGRWLAAWLLPPVLMVVGAVCYYVVFPAQFDPTAASYVTAAIGGADAYAATYGALSPWVLVLISAGQAILAAFLNLIPALGEEAGWRGYLYPHLKARFGRAGGRILGGLIWGVWHWPLILLAGYEYGYPVFVQPALSILGCLLFALVAVALGTLLDWVYEKTGSIWAPALCHGSFNAVCGLAILPANIAAMGSMFFGPTLIGLVGGLPLFVFAAVLLLRDLRADRTA